MTRYKSAVQKRNAAVLLRKPGRLASQYAPRFRPGTLSHIFGDCIAIKKQKLLKKQRVSGILLMVSEI